MYFPFLRGRQFELIALREYAENSHADEKIIPIIEPVKSSFNSIKLAINKFKENNFKFSLILNPLVGDLVNNPDIHKELKNELKDSNWIPTFFIKNNINTIKQIIHQNDFSDVMIICTNALDTGSDEFITFIESPQIKYIVSIENKSLRRQIKSLNKELVLLSISFRPQERNKDYLSMPEEKFTEEHLFFKEEGYRGFSDFTTIPNTYTQGGSTPYAVSIHWTYKRSNNEIWIKHFTSKSNEDQSNIQGKFAEAAQKASIFIRNNGIITPASIELCKYYDEAKYPGLGMVKKLSIKNHLELIYSIL